jgi:molybdopterin molybdotransferase
VKDFFNLQSSAEVLARLHEFQALTSETVALAAARDRVLAVDIHSDELLPPFSRSSMDGYAVRSRDTFGCSESEPALLTVTGEIHMGSSGQAISLRSGQAVRIATGGELPQKGDAVVMVEYTRPFDNETIVVYRPVAPGENVIGAGEDYRPGDPVLSAGHMLRPQDLGILSGLGITEVVVHRQPRVAILSTGDELIPADTKVVPPGKIRDINSTSLAALVTEAGGISKCYGICGDDFAELQEICTKAIGDADILLLSGGSSVGQRDHTLRVFESMADARLLAHGVSIRPGKPTILARLGNQALVGLPGHVASAMVVFYLFVRPLLRLYLGLPLSHGLRTVQAVTGEQIASATGREDYVRIKLTFSDRTGLPIVHPIYGRSGLLSPLVAADGLLPIGRDVEGLDKGVVVEVLLFP